MTGKPEVETDGRGGATVILPQGADYSLTESALFPFAAEPTQSIGFLGILRFSLCVHASLAQTSVRALALRVGAAFRPSLDAPEILVAHVPHSPVSFPAVAQAF